jgi:YHS domain-containing protein
MMRHDRLSAPSPGQQLKSAPTATLATRGEGQMTTDPVCGMKVEEGAAAAEAEHRGIRYFFCSESCKEEFLRHPGQYLGQGDRPGAAP